MLWVFKHFFIIPFWALPCPETLTLTLNKVEKWLCCLGPTRFPLEYLVRIDLSLEQPRFCREKHCESKGYSALNNNWLRELRFHYTCVWQGIRPRSKVGNTIEQHHVLEEAVGWEFRGLGFNADSANRSLSGFGEFLKPPWKSLPGGGWNSLSSSLPSLSC